MSKFTTTKRARLGPADKAMDTILGSVKEDPDCKDILHPLRATKGIIFPYTPDINFGGVANYGNFHFTHSNYQQWQFQNSAPELIQLTAQFTAQTNEEGRYMLAVFKFLRASTMLEFGNQAASRKIAGTPPPVLRFNYMGEQMFNNVPVVLQNFNYLLERDVDYVEIKLPGRSNIIGSAVGDSLLGTAMKSSGGKTYVPTRVNITLMLGVQPNPLDVRDNFDLDKFKRGDLINKGFI